MNEEVEKTEEEKEEQKKKEEEKKEKERKIALEENKQKRIVKYFDLLDEKKYDELTGLTYTGDSIENNFFSLANAYEEYEKSLIDSDTSGASHIMVAFYLDEIIMIHYLKLKIELKN